MHDYKRGNYFARICATFTTNEKWRFEQNALVQKYNLDID